MLCLQQELRVMQFSAGCKSHQLRMVHQDVARMDTIDSLSDDCALITQDFPWSSYQLSTERLKLNYLGKEGFPGLLKFTKAKKKRRGGCSNVCAHYWIRNTTQQYWGDRDGACSASFEVGKPCLVVYRQDNAGCYHSATTILACKLLRDRSSLDLHRIDFCDPQGGERSMW